MSISSDFLFMLHVVMPRSVVYEIQTSDPSDRWTDSKIRRQHNLQYELHDDTQKSLRPTVSKWNVLASARFTVNA